MKHFARLFSLSLVLCIVVAMTLALSLNVFAATEKVIYISDDGTGDGTSSASPLGMASTYTNNEETNPYYFLGADYGTSGYHFSYNSPLYLAAQQLAGTGGRIVLVGDVKVGFATTDSSVSTVDRDLDLPTYGENKITISAMNTSCKLIITEGGYLNLGGNTLFENITFASGHTAKTLSLTGTSAQNASAKNRAICCNGYNVEFAETVSCETLGDETLSDYAISICGSTRFRNASGTTNVTIKGGTWKSIYGVCWGLVNQTCPVTSKINISGGEFYGYISPSSRGGRTAGFIGGEVNISGGTFHGNLVASNNRGVIYSDGKVTYNISGCPVFSGSVISDIDSSYVLNYAPTVIWNFSQYQGDSSVYNVFSSYSKKNANDKLIYPAKFCTSVVLATDATSKVVFKGGEFNTSGITVNATYTFGSYVKNYYGLSVEEAPYGFDFVFDNSKTGSANVSYKYNDITFSNQNITVIGAPVLNMLGAQVKKDGEANDGIRFVCEMSKEYSGDITVTDYGFIALNDYYVNSDSLTDIYGAETIDSIGQIFRSGLKFYNDSTKTTFYGVYSVNSVADYDTDVSAVAFVKFTYGGNEYVIYSDTVTKSLYDVAKSAYGSSAELDTTKTWIKTNIIDTYDAYKANNNTVYDEKESTALRQEVVNYLNSVRNYAWTPSSTMTVGGSTYSSGTTYYGIPYVNGRKGTLEQFETYIKTLENGTNLYIGPATDVLSGDHSTVVTPLNDLFPGTDFSILLTAWNKVSTNEVWLSSAACLNPAYGRGTLAVGNYTYAKKYYTDKITTANGQSTMYSAYDAANIGDILLTYVDGGNKTVYMVTSVDRANDTITGVGISSLNSITKTCFAEVTFSYSSLYSAGTIPVTIPALATGYDTKTVAVVNGFDLDEAIFSGTLNGTLTSNRSVSSVTASVYRGVNCIYTKTKYYNSSDDLNTNIVDLSEFGISDAITNFVEGKEYNIKVSVKLASEENEIEVINEAYTQPLNDSSDYEVYNTYELPVTSTNYRDEVINAMLDMAYTTYWTPSEDIQLWGASFQNQTTGAGLPLYKAGVTYRGILYSEKRATEAQFEAVLGGTGTYSSPAVNDVSSFVGSKTSYQTIIGNHCSASMLIALQSCIRIDSGTRATFRYSNPNSLLKLFTYDHEQGYTREFATFYGQEAMYEQYATVKKGDFLYKNSSGGGHTRFAYADAVVVRDANGRIDGTNSYILCLEQTNTFESAKNKSFIAENGYDTTWWIGHKYTFAQLYGTNGSSACIFYEATEYRTGESETPYLALNKLATESGIVTSNGLYNVIESNYPISSYKIEIINKSTGATVASYNKSGLYRAFQVNLVDANSTLNISGLASGVTYTLNISAETVTAGELVLLQSLDFTK